MIRQPISAAIVVALSFAPALANEAVAQENRLALVDAMAETGAVIGSEEPSGLFPLEEITFDTDMAPYFQANVPSELRHAALRRMWQVHPGVNREGAIFDSTH